MFDISTFSCNKDDTIIISFDKDEYPLDEVCAIRDYVRDIFPDNNIICRVGNINHFELNKRQKYLWEE